MYLYYYPIGTSLFLIYLFPQLSDMINVERILQDYNAACGHLSCKHNNNNLIKDKVIYSIISQTCAPCSCDMSCVLEGNCCPDLYYSLGLACVQRSILEGLLFSSPDPILMINDCPLNGNMEERKLCNISSEQIFQMQNVPVTSKATGFVYRNLECLKCNKENASDGISWSLEINCGLNRNASHLNFLSSYDEILKKAHNMQCGITYKDVTGIKPFSRKCERTINTCNISGTWQQYDPDIDVACRTYDNKYFEFKNIFCYMCNPPTSTRNFISSCNVTGLWELHDAELEKACLITKQSSVTGEFKNIYCYLCNTKNSSTNDSSYADLLDTVVDIKHETNLYDNKFNFHIKINKFRMEHMIKSITDDKTWQRLFNISNRTDQSKTKCASCTSDEKIKTNTESLYDRMLDIYTRYFAFTGYAHFCKNYSIFTHLDQCDCDDFCGVYKPPPTKSGCCVDNANLYRRITTCLDLNYSPINESYLLNTECNISNNKAFFELCYNTSTDNVFYNLPASLTTSKDNFRLHFRNVFCAYCKIEAERKHHHDQIVLQLWDMHIVCNVYMVVFYHSSLQNFIQFAEKNNCNVSFDPPIDVVRCRRKLYSKCNMTGTWISYDPYVNWACEHFNMPTVNTFCEMCNPLNRLNISITTCNETYINKFDNNIYENCNSMPEIQYHAPFKNIFCRRCNELEPENKTRVGNVSTISWVMTSGYITRIHLPNFDMLFSVANLQRSSEKLEKDGTCKPKQIFSKVEGKCLDVLCYPGRILVNDECVPLLETTAAIGYVLSLELNGNVSFYMDDMQSFLNTTEIQMQTFIRDNANLCKFWYLNESIYLANMNFDTSAPLAYKNISVLIYQKLFCVYNVNRTGLEEQLLLLTKLNVSIWYSGNLYQFSLHQNANAFLLPSMVLNSELNNSFYMRKEVFNDFEKYSHVTELLLCKQVELKRNEFWIDNETLELNIIFKKVKLSNLEYTITPTNKIQICVEHYISIFALSQEKQSSFQYALGLALMISTCISLFCLIVTFLIYLLFPSLQTLPGKNNMCLIVSMISAHSLYQFGLFQTELKYACIVIGFLIHYFWLATFLCLNVCSFHMFRVFRSMTNMISFHDSARKTTSLFFYCLYSYGTPFLIVSINVVVTAIVRNDSGVGYGGVICFINNPISLIVTFILPILLVCLSNIVFFVVTSCRIGTTAKDSKERLVESNKLHYSIYIKLFTITGISWIFQIIDSFLPNSVEKNVFSAITSLLNSLQGVFIFVSYVCNKRVLHLLKKKVPPEKHPTTSTSSTRTTRM